ncbi:MAG: S8 family serine peptidase [Bacteroidales bacterium]|nr:S8 family serine peptidase [Bacteroidales bacterium]
MKKNHIILFLALVLSTLTFGQNFNAIEPELQKILNQKSEELIDIQIYFKSSIDSKQLNQATRKAYTKAEKKELVVNELKTYSENVQADVMNILRAEELSGNVSDIHNLWIASSISCKASASVIYRLSSHPDVKMIGYDKEFQLITPEQMEEIKSAAKSDVRAGGPDAHVQAVEAHRVWWEEGYTGKNVIVAVLDSGTNTNHLDLKDHLWTGYIDTNKDGTPDTYVNGWNFISDNSNITDDYGHGTHCAGIVCGDGTAIVTTGIAPDASLMTVKTINRTGGGSVAQMLKGVQFAVENGADVLSMSLGFKNNQLTTTQKEEIRAAFDNVLAANVVVCAAAGNDGDTYGAPNNVDYPAACPAPWRNPDQTLEGGVSSVICVGAHDLNESSRGPSTWEGTSYNDYPYNEGASMGLIRPDISAPGYIIRSTKYSQNDIYELKSGTSQATPCVAGVIALMLEKNSSLTPAQISQIIEETATSKPETKNNRVGAGVVNALAAVNSITEVVGNPFIQVSTFAPQVISTGKQTIGITMNNTGNGASEENTSVTLSLSNDPYITIANPTQNLGRIGANSNKTLFFELDVDAQTPSGHTATFSVNTTSGSLSWDNAFSINITSIPEITFQSVSPAVVKTNTSTDINVTIANTGTAAFSDSIKLKLVTISNDLKHVTLVDNETSIKPLGVGETGTGTFTIETKTPSEGYKFDFFLETYSEYSNPTNYVYEFENDLQGWTYFNASSNYIKAPWLHSTNATTLTDIHDSHSGKGHLMSITYRDGAATNYTPIDNYLVSPVKIKATENSKISFYACANNDYLDKEHFGLAVSTAGNTSSSDFTTVQDWIISDKTTWKQYTVDLSAYAGQEIYVAIRHFFTAQEWEDSYYGYDYCALNIDDIVFSDVTLSIKHVTTYSYDDPYYFNIMVSNTINLPMVENLTATAISSSKINLTWDAVNNVSGYNVYRDGQKIATMTETTFEDSKLNHETQYCYAVTTITSYGESGFSEETCVSTLEPTEAETPTNLVAVADSESTIVLTWDDANEATSYNVYQDTELIATELTSTMYIVNGLEAETEYCFTVTAVNKLGESDKSESACATTLKSEEPEPETLAAPVVTAEATSDTTILLTWEAVENAERYNIYSGTETIKMAVNATSYTVTGLEAETQYCFNVVAINRESQSEKSEDACATTLEEDEPVVPEPTIPAAPVLTAEAIGPYEIVLTWNAVEGATSYTIYFEGENSGSVKETSVRLEVNVANAEYCFTVTASNEAGESAHSNKVCVTTLPDAITENTSSFNVYPNPVNDKLYIEVETEIEEVVVYDIFGRHQVTKTPSHQGNLTIDVTELNSGVYFVKVVTENGEAVQRFIKK